MALPAIAGCALYDASKDEQAHLDRLPLCNTPIPGLSQIDVTVTGGPVKGDLLASGDFDNDGIDDVVFVDSQTGTVTPLYGMKPGGLVTGGEAGPTMGSGTGVPIDVVAADIGGDNFDDVAVLSSTGTVMIIRGGTGKMLGQGVEHHEKNYVAIAAGEVWPAGQGSEVVAVDDSGDVHIFGQTFGGSSIDEIISFTTQVPMVTSVAIGDYNGDGIADIALLTPGEVAFELGHDDGGGGFNRPLGRGLETVPGVPAQRLLNADLDGDARMGLVVQSRVEGAAIVVETGHFDVVVKVLQTLELVRMGFVPSAEMHVVAVDWDGQRPDELVVGGKGPTGGELFYLQDIASGYDCSNFHSLSGVDDGPIQIVVGQFDAAGKLDVLGVTSSGHVFVVPRQ